MSTSMFQLLLILVFVAIWYGYYLSQKSKSERERKARLQTAAEGLTNSHQEEAKPKPVLVECEPVPATIAEFESIEPKATREPTRTPTGVVCIVRKARRRLRCTEFEVDGELQTEVCRVDQKGRVIGEPSFHAGPYRDVTNALLNLKAA